MFIVIKFAPQSVYGTDLDLGVPSLADNGDGDFLLLIVLVCLDSVFRTQIPQI